MQDSIYQNISNDLMGVVRHSKTNLIHLLILNVLHIHKTRFNNFNSLIFNSFKLSVVMQWSSLLVNENS